MAILMAFAPRAFANPPNLASMDWSANIVHNLGTSPPANHAIWLFMNKLWDPTITAADLAPGDGKLCWFRFVDLRHSGELSLVALYDLGGTLDCDDLSIFDKVSGGIEEFDYGVAPDLPVRYDNANNAVQDLAGDGHWELVVRPYDAVTDEDLWPSVYAWTGGNYTNVSPRYPKFYENWLASLDRQIASLRQQQSQAVQDAVAEHPTLASLSQTQLESMALYQYGGWLPRTKTPTDFSAQYYTPELYDGSWQWRPNTRISAHARLYVNSVFNPRYPLPTSNTCN